MSENNSHEAQSFCTPYGNHFNISHSDKIYDRPASPFTDYLIHKSDNVCFPESIKNTDGSNFFLLGHLKLYHIPFMLENLIKMEVIKNREKDLFPAKFNFLYKFNFILIIFRKFNFGKFII